MKKIVRSPLYVFIVIFIALPINGALFERGDFKTGIFLSLLHIPWFLSHVLPVLKIYKASEERNIDIDDLV